MYEVVLTAARKARWYDSILGFVYWPLIVVSCLIDMGRKENEYFLNSPMSITRNKKGGVTKLVWKTYSHNGALSIAKACKIAPQIKCDIC